MSTLLEKFKRKGIYETKVTAFYGEKAAHIVHM